jgi:hypothetical protein
MAKLAEWNDDQQYFGKKNMQSQSQLIGADLVICEKTRDKRRTRQNE